MKKLIIPILILLASCEPPYREERGGHIYELQCVKKHEELSHYQQVGSVLMPIYNTECDSEAMVLIH